MDGFDGALESSIAVAPDHGVRPSVAHLLQAAFEEAITLALSAERASPAVCEVGGADQIERVGASPRRLVELRRAGAVQALAPQRDREKLGIAEEQPVGALALGLLEHDLLARDAGHPSASRAP